MVSVRGSLSQLEGVSEVQTDFTLNLCSFKIKMDEAVLLSRIEELAQTNAHFEGWSKLDLVGPIQLVR